MNKVFFGLPEHVKFCKSCVISNQRPSSTIEFKHLKNEIKQTILFDENGLCDACKYQKLKEKINWDKRNIELEKLLAKFRKNNGDYDVIVPGSGGKDSAYASHVLKYKYGMNPLTVTWAPHKYTDIGWKNFENWIHAGGFDNILFTPNGKLHRFLTNQAFKNLLHPFQPFIIGQKLLGPIMAIKYNIKLVMYGENQAEYGNLISENKSAKMKKDFFSNDDISKVFLGGKSIKQLLTETKFKLSDFKSYLPPKEKDIQKSKIEVHYLGYYLKWDPQECYYYAVENTGFEANTERTEGSYSKYSSIDDQIDPFHYYTTLIKFGLGRASYDASQEIRNNKITREEGVQLVKKYDQEFPEKYFLNFLEYIDINSSEFTETVDKFRSPHLWYKKGNEWKLKNTV
jgi:N-acetyl sugar amidotransferase